MSDLNANDNDYRYFVLDGLSPRCEMDSKINDVVKEAVFTKFKESSKLRN